MTINDSAAKEHAFRLTENWKDFFRTRDEGLGTTYERFVLHAHFRRIKGRYGVDRVLEAPVFGMTGISGINSLWWAGHGAEVTLADHSRERLTLVKKIWHELSLDVHLVCVSSPCQSLPFEDAAFDMSWNFAALGPPVHVKALLPELARVTRKAVFICVPNRSNLLGPFFNLLIERRPDFKTSPLSPRFIRELMRKANWSLEESGFLDVPPWPDIGMPKENLFNKIGLRTYVRALQKGVARKNRLCSLDYYTGKDRAMKRRIKRYAFLENGPAWLKRLWAHHHWQIFTPKVIAQ